MNKSWWRVIALSLPCKTLHAGSQGDPYLHRYQLFKQPSGAIYLHNIVRPDHSSDLHDHPWQMQRFVLEGGYQERYWLPGMKEKKYRSLNTGHFDVCPQHFQHTITSVRDDEETWTMVIVGDRVAEWGFYTADGFVPWEEYVKRGGRGTGVTLKG